MKFILIPTFIAALCINACAQTTPLKADTVANCQFKEFDGSKKPIYKDGNKWYIIRTSHNGKSRKQYVSRSIVLASSI